MTLVEDPSADELHELQPLFKHGLWIFGPEYESIDFLSNSSLATIIKNFFKNGKVEILDNPRKRPDFVALVDSSLGVYSRNSYDTNGEVDGIQKVLIVELKRGGSTICDEHKHQAEYYAKEIKKLVEFREKLKLCATFWVLMQSLTVNNLPLAKILRLYQSLIILFYFKPMPELLI